MIQKENLSKLELNAFLMKLTEEGWDEDAARAVVQAFCHLSIRSRRSSRTIQGQDGISMRGHTNEMGEVPVNIYSEEVKETIKGEKEGEAERIGYFKVYRTGENCSDFSMITFEYFWEADMITRSQEKPPHPFYGLEYFTNTLEPYALHIFEWEEDNVNLWDRIKWILESRNIALLNTLLVVGIRHPEIKAWRAVPHALYGKSKIYMSPRLKISRIK